MEEDPSPVAEETRSEHAHGQSQSHHHHHGHYHGHGARGHRRHRKVVHFVRHAEGEHNVAGREDPECGYLREDLEDARLTAEGVEQCRRLRAAVEQLMAQPEHEATASSSHPLSSVQLIVVSPLQRTLQTADHSFAHMKGRVPWLALESVRETMGLHPCDRRFKVSRHREAFPHVSFDLMEHDEDPLWHRYPTRREPEDVVERRGRDFLAWLAEREETSVVIVTHSSYLRTFCSRILGLPDIEHFENADLRSVELEFEAPGDAAAVRLAAARPVWESTGHHASGSSRGANNHAHETHAAV